MYRLGRKSVLGSNKKLSVRERKRLLKFVKGISFNTLTKQLKSGELYPDVLRNMLSQYERVFPKKVDIEEEQI